jgi:hypothetical protein
MTEVITFMLRPLYSQEEMCKMHMIVKLTVSAARESAIAIKKSLHRQKGSAVLKPGTIAGKQQANFL